MTRDQRQLSRATSVRRPSGEDDTSHDADKLGGDKRGVLVDSSDNGVRLMPTMLAPAHHLLDTFIGFGPSKGFFAPET